MDLGEEIKRHTVVPLSEPIAPGKNEPAERTAPALPATAPAEPEKEDA